MKFEIDGLEIDLNKYPNIFVHGETGSGKSFLLKDIHKQLSKNYEDLGFVFIDLKRVEWAYIKDRKKVLQTILDVSKVSRAIDYLLGKVWEKPIVIFCDTPDDYINENPENYEKFKQLITKGPQKEIFTLTCSSRYPFSEDVIKKFDLILIGRYSKSLVELLPAYIQQELKKNNLDIEDLNTGQFLIFDNKLGKIL